MPCHHPLLYPLSVTDLEHQMATPKDAPATEIDEDLYSRQLYVIGKEAMLKMANSACLLIGCGGLGVETGTGVCGVGIGDVMDSEWRGEGERDWLSCIDIVCIQQCV
ncbi:hypothetical protein KIPB_014395 [Kipferlia bialata]|uniref:THIF-type NAD/FAD binding fold domain-containing protein n=1 Tax=Kipferlia bialata TaxID=797122 RepID=A0A391NV85_9EUKA|nr:hypothetical protein KIPB_014395 [Kipferlia bialata]|eukprot:g14395.t1